MIKFFILLIFFISIKTDSTLNDNIPTYSSIRIKHGNNTINRPLFHFTPSYGWMNDPNGCWYDKTDEVYHIYFQYNPNDTIWGMPLYWGHATSSNLLTWEEQKIAIRAPDWAGAYSGSMFIDDECVSSWFTDCSTNSPNYQNAIAAWTWNDLNWVEYQCLSHSEDHGYTFTTEDTTCPAVNESDSTQFRDPQVVKFNQGQYIMSIAKSHEYSIHFYESSDLQNWSISGAFTLYGYLGFQYECPNLIKLHNNDKKTGEDDSYWVLFISINPGSQQGGSSTEYFFGNYTYGLSGEDSTPYTAKFYYNTLIDQGKDFYAMQIMYFPPDSTELTNGFETGIGITWASNWQYTKVVPTDPWRSSMAIPRRIKLGHYNPTGSTEILYVLSKALLDEDDMDDSETSVETRFDEDLPDYENITSSQTVYTIPGAPFGALELYIEFDSCDAYTDHAPGVINFYLRGGSIPEEYLRFGYNQKADAMFLDRGHSRVQWVDENPFFTDKLTLTVYGKKTGETQTGIYKSVYNSETNEYEDTTNGTCEVVHFKAHIIVDRNIIEIFTNEDDNGYSPVTSTNTFFFTGGNFITDVLVDYNSAGTNLDKGFTNIQIKGRHLNLKETSGSTESDESRRLKENLNKNDL